MFLHLQSFDDSSTLLSVTSFPGEESRMITVEFITKSAEKPRHSCRGGRPKSAEKPRHSCRGWIGVGRAGLNAQEPNKTYAVPEPSMGEGTAEVEAPAFMPGRMSPTCVDVCMSRQKQFCT